MNQLRTLQILLFFAFLTLSLHSQVTSIKWFKEGLHDEKCYTQGFSFINETHILESCGLYHQSYFQIQAYDRNNTQLIQTYKSNVFNNQYFLEGSIIFNGIIYILTWRENVVFRFDLTSLKELEQLSWSKEGWGMTQNGTHIFISDGSNNIYIVDSNMSILATIIVFDKQDNPVYYLNELEWVCQKKGQYIYSNVYTQNIIVKIDVSNGKVVKKFDLSNISRKEVEEEESEGHSGDVLNGIAFDKVNKNFIVTGKQWSNFYVIDFA